MDKPTYQRWWDLHIRIARGEAIGGQERIAYEEGRKELHQEEDLTEDISRLRGTRRGVMELDAKCEELHARRQQLKRDIARLEAALTEEVRRTLGIED
jgi:cell division protein FtsB